VPKYVGPSIIAEAIGEVEKWSLIFAHSLGEKIKIAGTNGWLHDVIIKMKLTPPGDNKL